MFEADRLLAAQLIKGDQRAYERFFHRYAQRLAAFAMRRTGCHAQAAEDIVQNVMIRAVRTLNNYRGEASLLTWLCWICRSEISEFRRRESRQPLAMSLDRDPRARGVPDRIPDPESMAFGHYATNPAARCVSEALSKLPQRYVEILEWKYGEDLSVEEISGALGLSFAATQSLLARAREAFRGVWIHADTAEASPVSAKHLSPRNHD